MTANTAVQELLAGSNMQIPVISVSALVHAAIGA